MATARKYDLIELEIDWGPRAKRVSGIAPAAAALPAELTPIKPHEVRSIEPRPPVVNVDDGWDSLLDG
jgi:hypothetical protein